MTNNKATIPRSKNPGPASKPSLASAKNEAKPGKSSKPKQYARQKKASQQQQQQQQQPTGKEHVIKSSPASASPPATAPSARSSKKSKQEWDVLKNQRVRPKQQQQQQQHRNPAAMSSKARRVERKRDIASMTDAMQNLELSTSPPSSSAESDDSDAIQIGRKKGHKQIQKQRPASMAKPSPAAFPPLKRNQQRRSAPVPPSNAAAPTANVYCGPCFSNAPAPSALPMPAFNPSAPPLSPPAHHHPSIPSTSDHDGVFVMEEYSLQQQSQQLMSLLAPRHVEHRNMMPHVMMTGHHPNTTEQTLSDIQRGLRSMLKISS